jgi:DNA (cytosine-5)-methyltransferase 1
MKLLAFHHIGFHKNHPRLFLDTGRLSALGFTPGSPVAIEGGHRSLTLRLAGAGRGGSFTVSQRRAAGGLRPVLDINSSLALGPVRDYSEVRLMGTMGGIVVTPSVRAFHIRKALTAKPPFRVMEFFAGGGTLSDAFSGNPLFQMIGGMEMDADFADCWQIKHPDALLIQGDIRSMNPYELPAYDILVAGIPCTDHSTMGRAKKSLAGCPETGGTGDLFIHVLSHLHHRMPLACVFENVPSFGTSLAGATLKANLREIGYHITETVVQPNTEWNEPSDRRRWVCVATLKPHFAITSPKQAFAGCSGQFLDAPDPVQDKLDAARIAGTISGLRLHNARHAAMGHGFQFTTLDGTETKIPTIPKSYHKINTGPFVRTPFGERLLRQHEIENIQGSRAGCEHYATAVKILGQGVQTRLFSQIVEQLGEFLVRPAAPPPVTALQVGQLMLFQR